MKILIVHNILNDSLSVSGVLKEYAHMANAWVDMQHPTDFLAAKAGWPQLQRLAPKSRLINSDGIFNGTRHLARTWVSFPAYAYRMLTAHWLRLPTRYDVIYASSPFVVEVYSALVLARRQRAKLVVKVQHLLAAQSHRRGLMNQLLLRAERISTRWTNQHADLVLALSGTVAKDYQAYERSLGLTPRPILPSGCGIELEAFPTPGSLPAVHDAVVLGRIHELKGVFDIPPVWKRVLAEMPKARLLLIGAGPHRPRLEQLCDELGVTASITFAGSVSELEKNQLLAQSKVGLSFSFEEGWGLSVTEFLAAGLPVVAYALPVFNEVFPGQLEIIAPHDHSGMAAKIVGFLRDESRRQLIGTRGREFVARYDYRVMAAAELTKLQSLCAPAQP